MNQFTLIFCWVVLSLWSQGSPCCRTFYAKPKYLKLRRYKPNYLYPKTRNTLPDKRQYGTPYQCMGMSLWRWIMSFITLLSLVSAHNTIWSFVPVLWIRIMLMGIWIRGSASGKRDPDPALGDWFLWVLFPLLGFPGLYFRYFKVVIIF